MVLVLMSEDNSIQMIDSFSQNLLTEIRSGVDYKAVTICFNVDRSAGAFVPEVN